MCFDLICVILAIYSSTDVIFYGNFLSDDTWKTLLRTSNPEPKVSISYYNLNLKTEYQFRVIALNAQGVSAPSIASESLRTIGE